MTTGGDPTRDTDPDTAAAGPSSGQCLGYSIAHILTLGFVSCDGC